MKLPEHVHYINASNCFLTFIPKFKIFFEKKNKYNGLVPTKAAWAKPTTKKKIENFVFSKIFENKINFFSKVFKFT